MRLALNHRANGSLESEYTIEVDHKIGIYYNANSLLKDEKDYHIFILDIEMPRMSGLVLAKEIRERNPQAVIIFLTSYDGYMEESFQVEPFRYLIKPIDDEKFRHAILKAIKKLEAVTITVADSYGKIYLIDLKSIKHIQSRDNYCQFHTIGEDIPLIRGTLKELMPNLSKDFIRVSRSSVVNLQYVEKILLKHGKIILRTGESIDISKTREKKIVQASKNYTLVRFRWE